MDRIFCKDKKGFCDCLEDCRTCKFAKGNGAINGKIAHDVLATLFGLEYDLDRLLELVEADHGGKCLILTQEIINAIIAGASAISFRGYNGGIVIDCLGKCGGPFTVSNEDAHKTLQRIGEAALTGKSMADIDVRQTDVAPVVRRRDCKYWGGTDEYGDGCCKNPDGIDNIAKADNFCSYGERKEKTHD